MRNLLVKLPPEAVSQAFSSTVLRLIVMSRSNATASGHVRHQHGSRMQHAQVCAGFPRTSGGVTGTAWRASRRALRQH
jgi:hypothetical protein